VSEGGGVDNGKSEVLGLLDLAAMAKGVNWAKLDPIQREGNELHVTELATADAKHCVSNMNVHECTNACFNILEVVVRNIDVYVKSGSNRKDRAEVHDERNCQVEVQVGGT